MKIDKKKYSAAPWRLVTQEGREVYWPAAFDHPAFGMTVINEPICGETRAECTEQALALLDYLLPYYLEQRRKIHESDRQDSTTE